MPRTTSSIPLFSTKRLAVLAALFLIALLPRLYSANTVGSDWFGPGSFTVINFDEANTCRAWLDAMKSYSPMVGAQTVFITSLLGNPPPKSIIGDSRRAKAYCLGKQHMTVARIFSAVQGTLTVAALGAIALVLSPDRPHIAWSASLLLALSGFHATQSHMATVDIAMTFYLYTFLLGMVIAVSRHKIIAIVISLGLLIPAVFSKHFWPMPLFAYLAFLPERSWHWFVGSTSTRQVVVVILAGLVMAAFAFNTGFQTAGWYPLLAIFYLFVPWKKLNRWTIPIFLALPCFAALMAQLEFGYVRAFTSGGWTTAFGSGFGSIGWNKLVRNIIDFPVVLVVGLGLPAALLIPKGIAYILKDSKNIRLWLCFLPVVVFAAYMLFIAPRTTYRHYLPLIPAGALLASYGFWSLRMAHNRLLLILFFVWPTLLLIDFEMDFHQDPRRQIVAWYSEHPQSRLFTTYYVSPPPKISPPPILFKPEYAMGEATQLKLGQYLILSENWYDTAYPQELNGPFVNNLDRLVKTTPRYARLYRQVLAGDHPNLHLEGEYNVQNFMPELVLHKQFYGTFQKFVGDLKIFRIVP